MDELRSNVDTLIAMFTSGERNPWSRRLGEVDRFTCFKELVAERGARYAACTLDNYRCENADQRAIVARLRDLQAAEFRWCRDGGGLLLYGPQGTGKDHLQFAMLRHAVIECGLSVVWRDGLKLQDEVRRAIGAGKEPELRAEMNRPHILAISDPLPPEGKDAKGLNDWNLGWLRDVIDRRYGDLKSTWITFNGTDPKELGIVLTPPLAARLIDGAHTLHCRWGSNRKPATI